MARTYLKLGGRDLRRIQGFALQELNRFLYHAGSPPGKFRVYRYRLIAICLCQGAAQHYLQSKLIAHFDRKVVIRSDTIREKGYRIDTGGRVLAGLKDIDVWFFFRPHPGVRIPDIGNCRKHAVGSFGRFGDRDLDFMKKVINTNIVANAKGGRRKEIVRSYLENANTLTSNCLAAASVVGLYPDSLLGRLIWKVEWWSNRNPVLRAVES
jgi:hypothetical protein